MYNYNKASKIFDRYMNLCCDPWILAGDEKQQVRRSFLRILTRNDKEGMKPFIDFIKETKSEFCDPYNGEKSKCWDFDLMREYDKLIADIQRFTN